MSDIHAVNELEFLNYQKRLDSERMFFTFNKYLADTDWYYARLAETGEAVPKDVTSKRLEARNFIRDNEHLAQKLY